MRDWALSNLAGQHTEVVCGNTLQLQHRLHRSGVWTLILSPSLILNIVPFSDNFSVSLRSRLIVIWFMGLLRKLMFVEELGVSYEGFQIAGLCPPSVCCGYPSRGCTPCSLLKQDSFAFLIFQYYCRVGLFLEFDSYCTVCLISIQVRS